jgi:hypothetical protein
VRKKKRAKSSGISYMVVFKIFFICYSGVFCASAERTILSLMS